MNILGIDGVIYGIDDMATCTRFWNDFGLQPREVTDERAVFATPEGSFVELRRRDDPTLPPPVIEAPTVRETVWGVDSAATLSAIECELARDREVGRDEAGTLHSTDAQGYPIAFRVSAVTPVALAPTPYNAPGVNRRVDQRGQVYARATPTHLAHVVFRAPEPDKMRAFYIDRLGFRLTDSYPGRGYFLRAGLSHDHHNLFAFNPDGSQGFHHIAFAVRDIHEVFGGGLHMTAQGWQTHLGPGRHPISSAYFWYFHGPGGGAVEYDFDSDVCTDDWQPREFAPTPDSFAEWALESGIERYTGIQTART